MITVHGVRNGAPCQAVVRDLAWPDVERAALRAFDVAEGTLVMRYGSLDAYARGASWEQAQAASTLASRAARLELDGGGVTVLGQRWTHLTRIEIDRDALDELRRDTELMAAQDEAHAPDDDG